MLSCYGDSRSNSYAYPYTRTTSSNRRVVTAVSPSSVAEVDAHAAPVTTTAPISHPKPPEPTEALLKKIIDHFNTGSYDILRLDVPESTYEEIQRRLQSFPGRLRFNYNYIDQKMIIYGNPSPVHESTLTFFSKLHNTMDDNLRAIDSRLKLDQWGSQGTILEKEGEKTRNKAADIAFVTRFKDEVVDLFPHFVVEIGYSETEAELIGDAKGWLCESMGNVLAVLIIKFKKPCDEFFNDITKWKGWIQVYVQSEDDPTDILGVEPRVEFLPPSDDPPELILLDDYFLTPSQMKELNYVDKSLWSFDLEKLVRVAGQAIACMDNRQRNVPPTQSTDRKRKISPNELYLRQVDGRGSRARHS